MQPIAATAIGDEGISRHIAAKMFRERNAARFGARAQMMGSSH
jgi:hypothetical protein